MDDEDRPLPVNEERIVMRRAETTIKKKKKYHPGGPSCPRADSDIEVMNRRFSELKPMDGRSSNYNVCNTEVCGGMFFDEFNTDLGSARGRNGI